MTDRINRLEVPERLAAPSPSYIFFGFESKGKRWIKMASPEKALVDFLYLSQARSRLFTALPEVELPRSFRVRTAREMIDRVSFVARRTHVRSRFEELIRRVRKST